VTRPGNRPSFERQFLSQGHSHITGRRLRRGGAALGAGGFAQAHRLAASEPSGFCSSGMSDPRGILHLSSEPRSVKPHADAWSLSPGLLRPQPQQSILASGAQRREVEPHNVPEPVFPMPSRRRMGLSEGKGAVPIDLA